MTSEPLDQVTNTEEQNASPSSFDNGLTKKMVDLENNSIQRTNDIQYVVFIVVKGHFFYSLQSKIFTL